MAVTDIERVLTVYRGIAGKDKALATRYVHPTRYTQHNPHAADGVAGLEEWIDVQPAGALTTVRAYQDGPYVFSQTLGDASRPFVFMDIFLFEEGLGVEHWVVWADRAPPNASGRTQTDGPTQAQADADAEAGKALVRSLYDDVLIPRAHADLPQFFHGDRLVEHDPGSQDGVAAFARRHLPSAGAEAVRLDEVRFVLGQGDVVLAASKGALGGAPHVIFDLWRVENGQLAEHWRVAQAVPPREAWRNDNGMI